jgi:hypothetical protein
MEQNKERGRYKIWTKMKQNRSERGKIKKMESKKERGNAFMNFRYVGTDIIIVTFLCFDRETLTSGETTAG